MSARGEDDEFSPDEFDRRLSRLAAATAEHSDPGIHRAVAEVLKLVREHMAMDVAFVSHLIGGRRVFRHVQPENHEHVTAGGSDPLEMSFCQLVIDGRLPELVKDVSAYRGAAGLPATPFPIGAHVSTPVVLGSGQSYGTLCCFSEAPNPELTERDLKRLRMMAQMIARLIDKASANADAGTP